MKTSRRFVRICSCFLLLPCLLSCSKNSGVLNQEAPIAHEASVDQCGFRASGFSGEACKTSFVAVLAYPEKYLGKRVVTYAYMHIEQDGNKFTFMLEPRIRSAPDLASCVQMEGQSTQDDRSLSNLEPGAIYSVSFAGTFKAAKNYICAGVFENVDFQDIAREPAR